VLTAAAKLPLSLCWLLLVLLRPLVDGEAWRTHCRQWQRQWWSSEALSVMHAVTASSAYRC